MARQLQLAAVQYRRPLHLPEETVLSMRWMLSLVALGLCVASAAQAGETSRFQLRSIQRINMGTNVGARLTISFMNEWGSPEKNQANQMVTLTGRCNGRQFNLGSHCMLGTGNLDIDLNYQASGLQSGQTLEMHGRWDASGHNWGFLSSGRSSGTLQLP